jgi:hypothetical protein
MWHIDYHPFTQPQLLFWKRLKKDYLVGAQKHYWIMVPVRVLQYTPVYQFILIKVEIFGQMNDIVAIEPSNHMSNVSSEILKGSVYNKKRN